MITKILKSKSNGDRLCFLRALLTLVAAAALGMSMHAAAEERTWVGESGGSWYVAANWSPSGVPGEKDTVVFSPDNELTVTISGGTSVCRAGVIRFESGKTYFAHDSSAVGLYMGNTVTNILHVAEGAEVVVSNRFHSSSGKRLRRTGKGKLTIVPGSNDWWNSSLNIPGRGPGQCERGFVRQRLQVQERREDAAA